MGRAGEMELKPFNGEDYTCITFQPDLSKFKMQSLDKDIVALMVRRAYDIAGSTKDVKVFLNGNKLPVSIFQGVKGNEGLYMIMSEAKLIFPPSEFFFLPLLRYVPEKKTVCHIFLLSSFKRIKGNVFLKQPPKGILLCSLVTISYAHQ